MIKRGFLILLAVIALSGFVSAQLEMNSNLKENYNIGDILKIALRYKTEDSIGGFLDITLDCGKEILIYRKYLDPKTSWTLIDTEWKIGVGDITTGTCTLKASYKDSSYESSTFRISDRINLDAKLSDQLVFPGESLEININATKANGGKLNGWLTVTIEGLQNQTIEVKEGVAKHSFDISKNVPPGKRSISLVSYEKNEMGEVINSGDSKLSFNIGSVPSQITFEGEDSLSPPKEYGFKLYLRDQIGAPLENESVSFKVVSPDGSTEAESLIKSGQIAKFRFPSNAQRGAWSIKSYRGSLSESFAVYILENREVNITFVNASSPYIKIINVGNVPFDGIVQIELLNSTNNVSVPVNLNLSIGANQLYTPELIGEYELLANNKTFGRVFLTGAVIGPGSLAKTKGAYKWFLLFILVLLGGYVSVYIIRKNKPTQRYYVTAQPKQKTERSHVFVCTIKSNLPFQLKEEQQIIKEFYASGVKLKPLNEKLLIGAFYSGKNISAYNFIKNANKIISRNVGLSLSLHAERFDEKYSTIKKAAQISKKIALESEHKITITELVRFLAGREAPHLKTTESGNVHDEERTIKMFSVASDCFQ